MWMTESLILIRDGEKEKQSIFVKIYGVGIIGFREKNTYVL